MNASIVYGLVGIGWFVTLPVALRALNTAQISVLPRRGENRLQFVATLVPLGWLFAAAGWAVAALAGLNPGGFPDEMVVLTAAHFVHAGFGLSVLHRLTGGPTRGVIHQAGMVAVALGINGVDNLQPVGAALLVVALGGYSYDVLRPGGFRSATSRTSQTLLIISAVAWIYPMWLAVSWAFAQVGFGVLSRSLDLMVAQHGVVNAVGVVLAGLVGFSASASTEAVHESMG